MSRFIAAIVLAFWRFVLISLRPLAIQTRLLRRRAPFACLAYSAGYFWFSWFTYHHRGDDGVGEGRLHPITIVRALPRDNQRESPASNRMRIAGVLARRREGEARA